METTLYDDSTFRHGLGDLKAMKRPITLDLDSPANSKKQRFASILTSPDLQMLKLASPELERFIIAQAGGAITTPTPTQILFPKHVTEEQEKYAKGFVDALALLHQGSEVINGSNATHFQFLDSSATTSTSASGTITVSPSTATLFYSHLLPVSLQTVNVTSSNPVSSAKPTVTTTGLTSVIRPPSVDSLSSNSYQGCSSSNGGNSNTTTFSSSLSKRFSLKEEELQMVPSDNSNSTPPLSPINLKDQEKIKLERKRYRNRIAASKCRQRKIERIAKLEEKVSELKNENTELASVATKLREQVCNLKQEVLDHVKNGCQIMITHAF